jgi:hypothetical protein
MFYKYMINKCFINPLLPQHCLLPLHYASLVPQEKSHTAPAPAGKALQIGELRRGWIAGALLLMASAANGADDPGGSALQQHQLQRQQQQESLQLRMQQQQRAIQSPPLDARQRRAVEQQQREQVQRQQDLHYRQGAEATAARPAEDAATRHAKDDIERLKTKEQGEALLRRSEAEQRQQKQ